MNNSDGDFIIENMDGYSFATGPSQAEKERYFSKKRRDDRQAERIARRGERKSRRDARRAKRGARPLKTIFQGGVKKFKEILPPVQKNADGSGTEADGTIIPKERVGTIASPKGLNFPPLIFNKADALSKSVEAIIEAGEPKVAVDVPANETTTINGKVFKTDDTIIAGADTSGEPGEKKGGAMSATTKWLIGGGIAAGLIIAGIVIYKKRGK